MTKANQIISIETKWLSLYNFGEMIKRRKFMKTIKKLLFLFLLLVCHDKVSFASNDIIIDYTAPGITIEAIKEPTTEMINDTTAQQNFINSIAQILGELSPLSRILLTLVAGFLFFILIVILKRTMRN